MMVIPENERSGHNPPQKIRNKETMPTHCYFWKCIRHRMGTGVERLKAIDAANLKCIACFFCAFFLSLIVHYKPAGKQQKLAGTIAGHVFGLVFCYLRPKHQKNPTTVQSPDSLPDRCCNEQISHPNHGFVLHGFKRHCATNSWKIRYRGGCATTTAMTN